MRALTTWIPLAFGVLWAAAGSATAQPDEVSRKQDLEEAHRLAAAGQIRQAAPLYQRVADDTPVLQDRAHILVELGILLEREAKGDPSPHALWEQSADAFRAAADSATGELRLKAANNYAAQLLRLNRPRDAADLLRAIWPELSGADLDPVARSRCMYNYARALEQAGDGDAAHRYYQEAFKTDPDFGAAQKALARLALDSSSESRGIPELLELTDGLIQAGEFDQVLQYVVDGLHIDHWRSHPRYPEVVAQLAKSLVAARVDPAEFRKSLHPELESLANRSQDRPGRMLRDIDTAYLGSLDVSFYTREVHHRYKAWGDDGQYELLSALLKMVGDYYFRDGRIESAFERYSNAWAVDTTNMQAGLYLVNLFTHEADRVPGYRRNLSRFVELTFDAKEEAYLGEDWSSILKFHTVLGTLFESQSRWGSRYKPRSAVFQWQHALEAHRRLVREDPGVPPTVPAVRESLARAYAGGGEIASAWKENVKAAEEYLKQDKKADARRVVRVAASLDHTPDAAEQEEYDRLRRALSIPPTPPG